MNSKDKAKELIKRLYKCMPVADGKIGSEESRTLTQAMEQLSAKQCALICVEEIINDNPNIYDSDRLNHKYWKEVKQEIENYE